MMRIRSLKMIPVIGDYIIDKYVKGDNHRLSPEGPFLLLDITSTEEINGGAAHVRDQIQAFGTPSILLPGYCRSVKTRLVSQNRIILRYDEEDKTPINSDEIEHLISSLHLLNFNYIVISDYKKGVVCKELLERLSKEFSDKKFLIDTKRSPEELSILNPFVVKVNRDYILEMMYNIDIMEMTFLQKRLNCKYLVVTLDKEGSVIISSDSYNIIPNKNIVEVCDVTGAGDIVIA